VQTAAGSAGISDQARIVRSADVALETPNRSFDRTLQSISDIATSLGGYVSQSDINEGSQKSATVLLRVPSGRFQEALDHLKQLSSVKSYSTKGEDVSKQYVDLQARLNSLRAQSAAMTRLLDKATSVSDILTVQQQLGQLQQQIEESQAEISYLDQSTTFASLAVTLAQQGPGQAPKPGQIRDALQGAANGFTATVAGGIVMTGTAAPVLLLIVGALLIGTMLRRRSRSAPR
jgi:hypothetical protein